MTHQYLISVPLRIWMHVCIQQFLLLLTDLLYVFLLLLYISAATTESTRVSYAIFPGRVVCPPTSKLIWLCKLPLRGKSQEIKSVVLRKYAMQSSSLVLSHGAWSNSRKCSSPPQPLLVHGAGCFPEQLWPPHQSILSSAVQPQLWAPWTRPPDPPVVWQGNMIVIQLPLITLVINCLLLFHHSFPVVVGSFKLTFECFILTY